MDDRKLTEMSGVKPEIDASIGEKAKIVSTMEEIDRVSYKQERFLKYFFEFHQDWKKTDKRLKSDSQNLILWNSPVIVSPEIKLHDILDKEFLGSAINYFDENNLFFVSDLSEEALLAFMYYSNVDYKKFKRVLEQIFVENHDLDIIEYEEYGQSPANVDKDSEKEEEQTETATMGIDRVAFVNNLINNAIEIKNQFGTYDKTLSEMLDSLKYLLQKMNSQEVLIQNHEKQLRSRADMISTLRSSNKLLATEKENLNNDLENWKKNYLEQSKLWKEEKEVLQKNRADLQQELSIRNQLLNDRDILIEELKQKINETNEKLEKSERDIAKMVHKIREKDAEADRYRGEAENSRNQLAAMVEELQMKKQAMVANENILYVKETEIVDLKAQLEESRLSVKEVNRIKGAIQRLLAIFRGEKQTDVQSDLKTQDKQTDADGISE